MKNYYGLIFKKSLPYMLAIASSSLTIAALIGIEKLKKREELKK